MSSSSRRPWEVEGRGLVAAPGVALLHDDARDAALGRADERPRAHGHLGRQRGGGRLVGWKTDRWTDKQKDGWMDRRAGKREDEQAGMSVGR